VPAATATLRVDTNGRFRENAGVLASRLSRIALSGFLIASSGGCRQPNPPTGRVIADTDVIGAWRYPEVGDVGIGGHWVFTIQFASDGTFRQTLVPPRARNMIQQTGVWRIEGGTLKMESLIAWENTATGRWASRQQDWLMIVSAKHAGRFAICGGLAADHSMDRELDRISDDECRLLTSLTLPVDR